MILRLLHFSWILPFLGTISAEMEKNETAVEVSVRFVRDLSQTSTLPTFQQFVKNYTTGESDEDHRVEAALVISGVQLAMQGFSLVHEFVRDGFGPDSTMTENVQALNKNFKGLQEDISQKFSSITQFFEDTDYENNVEILLANGVTFAYDYIEDPVNFRKQQLIEYCRKHDYFQSVIQRLKYSITKTYIHYSSKNQVVNISTFGALQINHYRALVEAHLLRYNCEMAEPKNDTTFKVHPDFRRDVVAFSRIVINQLEGLKKVFHEACDSKMCSRDQEESTLEEFKKCRKLCAESYSCVQFASNLCDTYSTDSLECENDTATLCRAKVGVEAE